MKLTLRDYPAPVEKLLEFDEDNFHWRFTITDQVLIPEADGHLSLNSFGNYCKIIAVVWNDKKRLKFESQLFEKDVVLCFWEKTLEKIKKQAKEKFELYSTSITDLSRSITV